jgi:hypothetical protein
MKTLKRPGQIFIPRYCRLQVWQQTALTGDLELLQSEALTRRTACRLEWENPFIINSQENIEHDHDDLAISAFLAQAAKAIENANAKAVAEDAAEALIAAEGEQFVDQRARKMKTLKKSNRIFKSVLEIPIVATESVESRSRVVTVGSTD